MTPEQAQACRVFMERVDLKGSEVQAWLDVVSALSQITAPPKRGRKLAKQGDAE